MSCPVFVAVAFPDYPDVTCRCMGGVSSSTRFHVEVQFQPAKLPAIISIFLPPVFIVLVNQASFMIDAKSVCCAGSVQRALRTMHVAREYVCAHARVCLSECPFFSTERRLGLLCGS